MEVVATPDDLRFYLPLGLEFARIRREDIILLRTRFKERSPMANTVLDEWLIDAKAEGEAAGFAKGELAAILHLVSKGRLAVDAARAEIADLLAAGTITRDQADAALAKLG